MSITREQYTNYQRAINEVCYDQPGFVALKADGIPGKLTYDALGLYQKVVGLPQTKQFDEATLAILDPYCEQRFMSDDQIRDLATEYGYEYAMVKAFVEVESRGFGFLTNPRAKILFERHKFYNEVAKVRGVAEADRLAKLHPDIINKSGGGYKGENAEWQRLEKAMKLSVNGDLTEGAIRSASWGLGQVMGFHAERLGYPNAVYMFAAAMKSERNQVEMILRFIKTEPGLDRAMRSHDFPTLAKLYNGVNYKQNNYDVKLEKAYNKYR